MIIFWIIVLVATILLEAATFALVSMWFAAGSIVALIAASLGAPTWLQFTLFILVSAILLIFTRPLLKKLFPKKFIPTNSELLVGQNAIVIEEIDTVKGVGRVRLNGVDWRAITDSNDVIAKDAVVKVMEVKSATLRVEK